MCRRITNSPQLNRFREISMNQFIIQTYYPSMFLKMNASCVELTDNKNTYPISYKDIYLYIQFGCVHIGWTWTSNLTSHMTLVKARWIWTMTEDIKRSTWWTWPHVKPLLHHASYWTKDFKRSTMDLNQRLMSLVSKEQKVHNVTLRLLPLLYPSCPTWTCNVWSLVLFQQHWEQKIERFPPGERNWGNFLFHVKGLLSADITQAPFTETNKSPFISQEAHLAA